MSQEDKTPEITTARLIIRPFKSLQEKLQYLEEYNPSNKVNQQDVARLNAKKGYFDLPHLAFTTYLVMDHADHKIGTINISLCGNSAVAEWSRYFKQEYQGKGYGTEALDAIKEYVILPSIGKHVNFISNPVKPWEHDHDLKENLVIRMSDLPLVGAYALVDSFTNYPSLSSDIKAGAKVVAILGNFVICAFSNEDLKEAAPKEQVSALSKAMFLNMHHNTEYDTQQIVDLLKCSTEPYTIISLTLMFLKAEGLIKNFPIRFDDPEISVSVAEALQQKGIEVRMIKDAFAALKHPTDNAIMQEVLDGYWNMVKESFDRFEAKFNEIVDNPIADLHVHTNSTTELAIELTGNTNSTEIEEGDLI
jgi:GNAT superfamily N-acetyltransferase